MRRRCLNNTPEIAQEAIDIYDFSDCDNADIRNELRDDLSDDECAAIRASFRKAWELADIEYKLELAENQLTAEKDPSARRTAIIGIINAMAKINSPVSARLRRQKQIIRLPIPRHTKPRHSWRAVPDARKINASGHSFPPPALKAYRRRHTHNSRSGGKLRVYDTQAMTEFR